MRFKLDENLGSRFAEPMRRAGHDVALVRDQGLGGKSDDILIEVCRIEERILVTLDLDFANVLSFPPWRYPGIAVLRPSEPIGWQKVAATIETLLHGLEQRSIRQRLWIVDRGRIRESDVQDPAEERATLPEPP